MVKVCKEWFPETNGFYMDDRLLAQLEILLKNIDKDWDFTILITGQGEVRVGKSLLALQICVYWAYEIQKRYKVNTPFNLKENVVYEGKDLIKQGNIIGTKYKFPALLFDEAGADLEGKKIMSGATKDVLDFFRECGQYNMLNVLVLPEFFDLPKGIALSRSVCLIDVFYKADERGYFKRGFYNFYSRRSKKWLYLKGKKNLDYHCVKSDFGKRPGQFYNTYPVDEKEYRALKQEALKHRESKRRNKFMVQRDACIYLLCGEKQEETGKPILPQTKLCQRLEQLTGIYIAQQTTSDALRRMNVDNEDFNED